MVATVHMPHIAKNFRWTKMSPNLATLVLQKYIVFSGKKIHPCGKIYLRLHVINYTRQKKIAG